MVKGFKGFNQDLTCRGFQYEIGESYEQSCYLVLISKQLMKRKLRFILTKIIVTSIHSL